MEPDLVGLQLSEHLCKERFTFDKILLDEKILPDTGGFSNQRNFFPK